MERNRELKLQAARAQLGTALELFTRHRDAVSTHALICGAAELLQGLAKAHPDVKTLTGFLLSENPGLTPAALAKMRNQHWNAIKHFNDHKDQPRNDVELLEALNDGVNEDYLFIAWGDYGAIAGKLPIAAQVFQVWWYANNEARMDPTADPDRWRAFFPSIANVERVEKKRRLRRATERFRENKTVMTDPRTDPTPLVAPIEGTSLDIKVDSSDSFP